MTQPTGTRRTIPAADKAQAEVDRLTKRLNRLRGQRGALVKLVDAMIEECERLEKRLAYARENPDLPAGTPGVAVSSD